MDKFTRRINWELVPASDQQYLKFSYKKYKHMHANENVSLRELDSFVHWLQKRGIQKN